jgi:hypothetical protein
MTGATLIQMSLATESVCGKARNSIEDKPGMSLVTDPACWKTRPRAWPSCAGRWRETGPIVSSYPPSESGSHLSPLGAGTRCLSHAE